jgi:hypothetical protein
MDLQNNNNTMSVWYIRATKENISTLRKWLVSEGKDYERLSIGDICSSYRYKDSSGRRCFTTGVIKNFNSYFYVFNDYSFGQEITFEDFKEVVLKEDSKPIFKTNSGKFLYKKDSFYIVHPDDKGTLSISKKLNVVDFRYKHFPSDYRLFKTKKQAEDYFFKNNLSLSLKDLLGIKEIKENKSLVEKINKIAENNCAKKLLKEEDKSNFLIDFANPVIDFGNPIIIEI